MTDKASRHADHASSDPEVFERVFEFHGHKCPGAYLGIRIAQAALEILGHHSKENHIVARAESSLCEIDPIQYLTGCTFGKRNLIHQDHGKRIYTFWRLSDETAIRFVAMNAEPVAPPQEMYALHERIHEGTATAEQRDHFEEMQHERQRRILHARLDQLFRVENVTERPPPRIRLLEHLPCASCGEATARTHLHCLDDEELCPPCFATRTVPLRSTAT